MLLSQTLQLRTPILMDNAIWFIILIGITLIVLLYILWSKQDIKLLILFLGLGAIAGFLENVIFIWLQSYEYYPGILEDPYYDKVLGAYLSQVYYVSTGALVVAAYRLRFRWILLVAAIFVALEYLFLSLGIYKHNWWHTSYTAVGLIIYFWISKKWYKLLLQASSQFMRWFTMFCANNTIYANLLTLPLYANHYQFVSGLFVNDARDTITFLILSMFIRSSVWSVVCYYRLGWSIRAFVTILLWLSYLMLVHMNIMSFKSFWDFIFFAASDIVVLLIGTKFNNVLLREPTRISTENTRN